MKCNISNAQMKLGRMIEKNGITTISQFVKAIERREYDKINNWKKRLNENEG